MADELVEGLLAQVTQRISAGRRFPEATYRLQLHAGFTFREACRIVPYLRDLGITHCYASPYLKARPGSTHGYDITDHRVLNPEIGTDEDHSAWVKTMRDHGLGQILDMVPNHMGVVGNENPWWNDVLENGPASPYAAYFDIAWYASPRPELQGRVLIPILGDPYGKVLEASQLQLDFESGAFRVNYFEHRFPVDPHTYDRILGHRLEELEAELGADNPALHEYQSILTAVGHLPPHSTTEPPRVAERQREKEVIKRRLAALVRESPAVGEFIRQNVVLFNGKPGDRHSFDLMESLLDQQAYRLSFWRVASDEINYRRFFDINELAALSMEREEVFEATHELVFRFLAEGVLDGLRIDHPDGLYDPWEYLQRLQQHFVLAHARRAFTSEPRYQGQDWGEVEASVRARVARAVAEGQNGPLWRALYVVVEKILGDGEALPEDWSIHGTSGYDFLNVVNGLFVDGDNESALTRFYHEGVKAFTPFPELVYEKKYLILRVSLSSELYVLASQVDRLAQKNRWSRDFTLHSLRHALRDIIACFPVYRSYIRDDTVRPADRKWVEKAIRGAQARNPTMSRSIFRFVRDMLLLKYPEGASDSDRAEQQRFAGKFQQVTAPVTAKGIEDTAFYVYNRLISLNEVGGEPARFGVPATALHRYLKDRQAKWPYALSPLSTHDTKRSEDVRARINVLSEMTREWVECVVLWSQLNEPHRQKIDDVEAPDPNEEYLLYQTLVGAWPLEPYSAGEFADFVQRIQAYLVKALHEAKVHTSWINPDTDYDNAAMEFVARILDEQQSGRFLMDFRAFQKRVSHFGLFNSLAQTLLRITAPGVPDTYQGTELWDFSLVDPDNRRPVDYERRRRLLQELQRRVELAGADRRELARELTRSKEDGRIKLYLIWQALCQRRDHKGLYSTGEYVPIAASGPRQEHVFGFLRRQGDRWAAVVVPRLFSRLTEAVGELPFGKDVWQDTRLLLPGLGSGVRLRNVFTGETLSATEQDGQGSLLLADVFGHFPVALFVTP